MVLDLEERRRGVCKLWEEGRPPCFALEAVSSSSEIRNTVDSGNLRERLGIEQYFLFQPDPGDGLRSETLGVLFHNDGEKRRVRDVATGMDCPWGKENRERREAEAGRRAEAGITASRALPGRA